MKSITSKITLPETGFLRLSSIIGDRKSDPPIPAIIPVSRSTWLAGVKSGRFPKSIKLGPRITVWRVEDIRSLIHESQVSG
ncbi:MAG: helix-turn-helix transcriptional regulator [Desulfobulbaceae bacterium]